MRWQCVVWLMLAFGSSAYAVAHRPHIVFILVDDLGYNDIGYHAREHKSGILTPFLDKLAQDGVKLENYYVQPSCTPSRSQLMSGRYQIRTGLQHSVLLPGQRNGLPLNNRILPEQLRNCGYDTHMVGKWHLGFYKSKYMPQHRGFNSYFGTLNSGGDHYTHVHGSVVKGVDMRNTRKATNRTWGEYSAFTCTKAAGRAIRNRDKSKPFFLYLAFQLVHSPIQAPIHYLRPFQYIKNATRRIYAGMVAALDEAVKNVTDHLRQAGMLNDTIIIFSTDNGGTPRYGGNNWPLRGAKKTLWEGGIKGVGFISGTPLGLRNTKAFNFMHISDWLPTILKATNCPKMNDTPPLDGVDQWNAILHKEKSPRTELLHNIDPLEKLGWKSSFVEGFDVTIRAGIRSGPWKLLTGDPGDPESVKPPELQQRKSTVTKKKNKKKPLIQLFNIESDPYERKEISSLHPDIVNHLLARLVKYNKTAVRTRFPPSDPKCNPKYHKGFWEPWADRK